MDGPGRPSLYKPEFAEQAFELCLAGATNQDLADTFEVGHSTVDNWLKKHPEFAQSVKRGRALADGRVARGLYSRAIGYTYEATRAQPLSRAMARWPQAGAGRGTGLEPPGRGVRAGASCRRGRSRRTSLAGVCFSAGARGCSRSWRRRRRPC